MESTVRMDTMLENMTMFNEIGDRCVLTERMIDAPAAEVYQKTVDSGLVSQWWGPAEMSTMVDKMDVRVGGAWRYIQHDKDGKEFIFHGQYNEVVPNERLSYTFIYEAMPEQVMTETVTFIDLAGKTLILIADCFESKDQLDQMMKMDMKKGATESMDRFAMLFHPAMAMKQ
jgi:uncharacterized protein YndB with AHSA1/START domain